MYLPNIALGVLEGNPRRATRDCRPKTAVVKDTRFAFVEVKYSVGGSSCGEMTGGDLRWPFLRLGNPQRVEDSR